MAPQSYAIDIGHPPAALLRLVNPVLNVLLRTPLTGTARKQLMVLSFTGRKTGRQFTIPLSAHVVDGELYALTGAPWKANFRDGAAAQVVHGGRTTAMRGELVADRAALPDLYLRCAQSYGAKRAQRLMGLKFREPRVPSREEFDEAIGRLKLAAVHLTPAE